MIYKASDLSPDQTLAELAASFAGASRVFLRHSLDFCCHGNISITAACAKKGLDPAALLQELQQESGGDENFQNWTERPLPELIEHILLNFHEPHREELPRLIVMAKKVEAVHGPRPDCPQGLCAHLEHMHEELESHMQKEERILFPAILAGVGAGVRTPISVLEAEHEDHGKNLAQMRLLTKDFQPPADACGTWNALYLGLEEFERDIMTHIHLENSVLFPRALQG